MREGSNIVSILHLVLNGYIMMLCRQNITWNRHFREKPRGRHHGTHKRSHKIWFLFKPCDEGWETFPSHAWVLIRHIRVVYREKSHEITPIDGNLGLDIMGPTLHDFSFNMRGGVVTFPLLHVVLIWVYKDGVKRKITWNHHFFYGKLGVGVVCFI
jgi:hypothetical protein